MINRVFLALDEDEEVGPLDAIPMPPAPSVDDIIAPTTESDRARAWLAALDLDGMKTEDVAHAEFFHYELGVYRSERLGYYLSSRSPQQKQRRYSHTTLARGTRQDLVDGLEAFLSQMEAKAARRQALTAAKRQARTQFVNPYHVGEFLHSSWGYDQTNVEMYQILEVRPVSLKLCQVYQERTQNGYDCGTCTPRRDEFKGKEFWVTIQVYESGYHHIPSPIYGGLYKYDDKPVTWTTGH